MPWPQTVPCTVRTSKTKVVQSKSWLLQQLEFRAFGPAKPSGPRLLSTFIWLNITDLLSFKLLWMLSSLFYCTYTYNHKSPPIKTQYVSYFHLTYNFTIIY